MIVYIEYAILNNLVANTAICLLTSTLAMLKKNRLRLILTVLFATAIGVLSPLIKCSDAVGFFIKLCSAVTTVIILGSYKSIKKFLITLLIFYGISFAVAGSVTSLLFVSDFIKTEFSDIKLSLCIFIGITVFLYIASQALSYIKTGAKMGATIVLLPLASGKDIEAEAFLDTGNNVHYNGVGVTFVNNRLKARLRVDSTGDFISVRSIGGEKYFEVFTLPYMRLKKNGKVLSLPPLIFWDCGNKAYEVILHSGQGEVTL